MEPRVSIVTYSANGVVTQISHTLLSEFRREDIVGTSVRSWGDAGKHLAQVLFEDEPYHMADITWDFQGKSGITRVTSMRLHPKAAVVVVTHRAREWELTDVEASVIAHIADGLSATETANRMHISEAAVRSAILRVRTKTQARSTAHAVAICCRAGVI